MILVLLQNGWSSWYTRIGLPGEEPTMRSRVWARGAWIEATWACRSGQNLAKILANVPDEDIWLDDTTLLLSPEPSGIQPIDPEHIGRLLEMKPEIILACGKQAEKALEGRWDGSLIVMSHPAYRVLNNQTIREANRIIHARDPSRCRVWPTREGRFIVTELPLNAEITA